MEYLCLQGKSMESRSKLRPEGGLLAELSVNIRMGKRNGEWAPGYQGGNKYSSGFFPEMMAVTAPVAAVPERQGLPLGNVPCAPARLPAVPHYSAWFSSAHFLYCADPVVQ